MARRRRRPRGTRRRKNTSGTRKVAPRLTGTVHVSHSQAATVVSSEGSYPVAHFGRTGAMHGDLVQFSVTKRASTGQQGGQHAGQQAGQQALITSVIERKTLYILGRYEQAGPLGTVVPLDARLSYDFFVLPNDQSVCEHHVACDDIVRARILSYPSRYEAAVVTIEERLGAASELDLGVESVIATWNLETEFSQASLDEAEALQADDVRALSQANRCDLRQMCCVTIDPADAKDFDDAVVARRLSEGGYELAVHIADVSHYVRWDSSLDLTARARGCSCYLVDRVIPMLPERLSNDLCSLRPLEDRLAMSVIMRLDERGQLLSADMTRSLICSHARLNYDEVDEFLAGHISSDALATELASGTQLAELLFVLDEISQLRQTLRRARGAIDFQAQETKVMLDEHNKPQAVCVRGKTPATSLVEEAMLLANEAVAKKLADAEITSAFRVHESPSPESLAALILPLKELGLAQGKAADELVAGNPHAIQHILDQVSGKPEEYLVSTMLVRAMKRAIYMPHNQGHYALGATAYCHFTSPIRRYPDLVIHRSLKALLDKKIDTPEQRSYQQLAEHICVAASEQERVADAAAAASQRVKLAEFYSDKISERFSGIVSGVVSYGLFVRLDETLAEGLLPIRRLGDEWFDYDDVRLVLRGEESGRVWRMGQRVAVTITATDSMRGRIDFALADPVHELRPAASPASRPTANSTSRPAANPTSRPTANSALRPAANPKSQSTPNSASQSETTPEPPHRLH